MKSYIICISGPPGVGKSTLAKYLNSMLPDSVYFIFDAYQKTLYFPSRELFQKLQETQQISPTDIRNNKFYEDLTKLYNGEEIIDPLNRKLKPSKFIILEEPYGRFREGMSEIIHKSVYIEVPPEISLSRRLLRNIHNDYKEEKADQILHHIRDYLLNFINGEGYALRLLSQYLKETADIIVDGLKPSKEIALEVLNHIKPLEEAT